MAGHEEVAERKLKLIISSVVLLFRRLSRSIINSNYLRYSRSRFECNNCCNAASLSASGEGGGVYKKNTDVIRRGIKILSAFFLTPFIRATPAPQPPYCF